MRRRAEGRGVRGRVRDQPVRRRRGPARVRDRLSHGEAPLEQGHHDGGGRGRARPRLRRAGHGASRVAGRPAQHPVRARGREGRHGVRQAGALPRHGPALLRHQPRRLGTRGTPARTCSGRIDVSGLAGCSREGEPGAAVGGDAPPGSAAQHRDVSRGQLRSRAAGLHAGRAAYYDPVLVGGQHLLLDLAAGLEVDEAEIGEGAALAAVGDRARVLAPGTTNPGTVGTGAPCSSGYR